MSKVSDCEKDIRDLKRYADELERALDAVQRYSGVTVWSGPAGDRFRADWGKRAKEVRDALQYAKEEMERIKKKLEAEEAEKKKGDN
ncbi:hypothetical protein AAHZ94_01655 [Streptomyces sp. HSW2009]|uniref:WXG100 family type VII secretion target n=1 Tax=Streptomyces sp. HSW2009 TaxID=3142890 RepID=UPI0032EE956E